MEPYVDPRREECAALLRRLREEGFSTWLPNEPDDLILLSALEERIRIGKKNGISAQSILQEKYEDCKTVLTASLRASEELLENRIKRTDAALKHFDERADRFLRLEPYVRLRNSWFGEFRESDLALLADELRPLIDAFRALSLLEFQSPERLADFRFPSYNEELIRTLNASIFLHRREVGSLAEEFEKTELRYRAECARILAEINRYRFFPAGPALARICGHESKLWGAFDYPEEGPVRLRNSEKAREVYRTVLEMKDAAKHFLDSE